MLRARRVRRIRQIDLEGQVVRLGILGLTQRPDQVDRARLPRCVAMRGTGGQVVAGWVGAVANDAFDHDIGVFFDPVDGRQQGLPVAGIGGQVIDVQDQFTR